MNKIKYILITLISSFFFGNIAFADGHSGSFSFHTGWYFDGTVMQIDENNIMGTGFPKGATFNDAGSGYLHNGEAQCVATFYVNNGVGAAKGWCAWSDNDGDRLFTEFSGSLYVGENIITGGTGKFAGWTGSGPWACEDLGKNGSSSCRQTLNYTKP